MKEPWRLFARLTPKQIAKVSEECLGTGPYRILHVKAGDYQTVVTVQFKDGSRRKVTV